jgi:UDP-N-acetylglucosamine 2-epimerase (non-hydrolysing)/GDP/UDP-N,N'-diacetylbacillosamine 2-epimerase (hydrolysing)
MHVRKICVVTATRAEYGLLYWVMDGLRRDPSLRLQIIAAGMHLSPVFGLTYREIENDGFSIDRKIEMPLSDDSPGAVTTALGCATIDFADALAELQPDLLVLLGDRYETLAAAQAALIARVPVAHIAGGDVTEGAYDDAIRHSITKMSHLHFVTHAEAARRVRQLGEAPERIFTVGNPGLDQLRHLKLMAREELARELGFAFRRRNLLVTYHPETLDAESTETRISALLQALERLGDDVGLIFTLPNADTGNRAIRERIETYVATHANARACASLGPLRYWSTMKQVDAVVGNSSSGLLEAPSLQKPAVNIGDRQKGRPRAASVIDCGYGVDEIVSAIRRAFDLDCRNVVNPYGDGHAAERIVAVLKHMDEPRALLKKRFADL